MSMRESFRPEVSSGMMVLAKVAGSALPAIAATAASWAAISAS